jgi:hypothetical protein
MNSDEVIRRPIVFHAVTLGLILSFLGGLAAATFQGLLRSGADQPQLQMVDSYVSQMSSGQKPGDVLPPGRVDLQQSLEPFAIFYNDQGEPVSSTGYLNQAIPVPPLGVFNYVRSHSRDKITWQPQRDVRVAAALGRVGGPNPGFVLVGRSLRAVEQQESVFRRMTFTAWFILVALLAGGGFFLDRAQTRHLGVA